jgi:hypothetical protein
MTNIGAEMTNIGVGMANRGGDGRKIKPAIFTKGMLFSPQT